MLLLLLLLFFVYVCVHLTGLSESLAHVNNTSSHESSLTGIEWVSSELLVLMV